MIKQIQKRVRGLLSSLVLDKTAAIFIENTRCNIVARCFSSAEWPGTKLHTWQLGISHLLASSKEPVCLLSAKKWANKNGSFPTVPQKTHGFGGYEIWRASECNQPKAYNTPVFKKTKREELAEKWDNLGFSIRPMNGHVRPGCMWISLAKMAGFACNVIAILGKQVGYGTNVSFPWFLIWHINSAEVHLGRWQLGLRRFCSSSISTHAHQCRSRRQSAIRKDLNRVAGCFLPSCLILAELKRFFKDCLQKVIETQMVTTPPTQERCIMVCLCSKAWRR